MSHLFQFRLSLILGQLLLLVINHIWLIWPEVSPWLVLICAVYLLFIIVLQWSRKSWHLKPMMILLDLMLWAVFFAFLEGVSNPLIWCLLIPAVLASLSQSTSFTWLVTVASNAVYLWLWYLGVHISQNQHHGSMMANHITGMWLGFIFVSLLLTWATTRLMYRVKSKSQALLKLEQQRQADENILKMATLATSLAHELGTPLTSIQLLVNELKHEASGDFAEKDLVMLESQVIRCKNVLAELTAITDQSRAADAKSISVLKFFEELLETFTDELPYKIDVHIGYDLEIMVDELFKLACLNVLNNSRTARPGKLVLTLRKESQSVFIKFKDEGVRKEGTHSSGLGIGLKLSQRIIVSMGGDLEFIAKVAGAETVIRMPVHD